MIAAQRNKRNDGILGRVRDAWQVLTGSYGRSSAGLSRGQWVRLRSGRQVLLKEGPYQWPAWRETTPQWRMVDYEAYYRDGYERNSIIYSAISYKARSASQALLKAFGGDYDNPKPVERDHPLAQLTARPNRWQSGREFQMLQVVYLNLTGNAFTYLYRPAAGALPTEMWPLRPDRVVIVPGDKEIKGYKYIPEGKSIYEGFPIMPEDMMHVKLPNPYDPFEGLGYGLSPLSPGAQSGDVDNMFTEFLNMFFRNGAVLQGVLTTEQELSDEEIAEARDRFQEVYGGYQQWSDVAVLGKSVKYERIGMTFDEMAANDLDNRNESRILGPFGVPPILIGTRFGLERSTFNNYGEARRIFWEDTMTFELSLFQDEYRYFLQGDDGTFVGWDYSNVPALRKDIPALVDAAHKLWSMGYPARVATQTVGLKVEETDNDERAYVPLNMVPVPVKDAEAETAGEEPEPPTPQPARETDDSSDAEGSGAIEDAETDDQTRSAEPVTDSKQSSFTLEQKRAIWETFDRIAESWDSRFGDAAVDSLEHDRREVQAIIADAKSKALAAKATVQWALLIGPIENYLYGPGAEKWRENFRPLIAGLVIDQGKFWGEQLGLDFAAGNVEGEEWFTEYILKFAQDDIQVTTRNGIHELLQLGMNDGWSIDIMSDRLGTLFDQWMYGNKTSEDFDWLDERMPVWRRELIARTETVAAANYGSAQLFERWGVTQKEWLTQMDGRQRESHGAANGQIRDMDQPFEVGGEPMDHPGDKAASIGNIANCRCTLLPVLGG